MTSGACKAMGQAITNAALRRMVRKAPAPAAAPAPFPPRLIRAAITRAADRAAGLPLVVLGIEVTETALDELVAALDPGQLLVMLAATAGPEGVLALDASLRAALIEMQTVGRLLPQPPATRDPTTADLALAEPFVHHLLTELRAEAGGTPLAHVLAGMGMAGRFANARAASLALPDAGYRLVRVTLDLGQPDRQASLMLALPRRAPPAPVAVAQPANPAWSAALARAVMEAPCTLNAVLHRLTLSLGKVEGFAIGQIVPLPGVTVASVRVEGPGGAPVGPGKLGQMGGMRAVRLGGAGPRAAQMEEMLPLPEM